uniref:PB1-like domain-containing protein n=1 Tax=Chenopodium quinoa TaxID=63459 RepID=A0A803M7X8_CHEQI
MSTFFDNLTIRFWHGGNFKIIGNEKCGYASVNGMFYLIPGMILQDGLRRIEGDTEVLELVELTKKFRALEIYLLHHDVGLILTPREVVSCSKGREEVVLDTGVENPPQIIEVQPVENPSQIEDLTIPETQPVIKEKNDYELEDNRRESPLTWSEIVSDVEGSSEEEDPLFEVEYHKFCEGYEFEDEDDAEFDIGAEAGGEFENDFRLNDLDLEQEVRVEADEQLEEGTDYIVNESDVEDDELLEPRDRLKIVNTKLVDLARQLEQEAREGKLG